MVKETKRTGHNSVEAQETNRELLVKFVEDGIENGNISIIKNHLTGNAIIVIKDGDTLKAFDYYTGTKVKVKDVNGEIRFIGYVDCDKGNRRQYIEVTTPVKKINLAVYDWKVALWGALKIPGTLDRYTRWINGDKVGHKNSDSLDNRDINIDVYSTKYNNWVTSIMIALNYYYPGMYTEVYIDSTGGKEKDIIVMKDRNKFISHEALDSWQDFNSGDRLVAFKTSKDDTNNLYSLDKTDRIIKFFGLDK